MSDDRDRPDPNRDQYQASDRAPDPDPQGSGSPAKAVQTRELFDRLKSLPKADLHRHLAGSITPEMILDLHREKSVPIPSTNLRDLEALSVLRRPMSCLQEVLERFRLFQTLFVDAEAIEYLSRRVVEEAAKDNVVYLELRFSPVFMGAHTGLPLPEVVESVIRGAYQAAREQEIVLTLIAISTREFGPDRCFDTVRIAADHVPHITGVDLAGDEDQYPLEAFEPAFKYAREKGLRATVHAGEQAHPENVRKAVTCLNASRIGHGIQAAAHDELCRFLAARGVPLEVCLTSNTIVSAVRSIREHPVRSLLERSVGVCLCSDDPGLFGVTLTDELVAFCVHCAGTLGEVIQLQMRAMDAGFAQETRKGLARQRLREWMHHG